MLGVEPVLGYQLELLFFPLYGLMASRYRREDAVTVALTGRDFFFSHLFGFLLEVTLTVI